MLQLRFVPVSQGTWVFVPVFIWIRADLSTCTNALLNHGLNLHAGYNLNPTFLWEENIQEAAANPSAQQCRNFSKNSVSCFILCILPSESTLYIVVSLPTADWQPEVHFGYLWEQRDAQVRSVTAPKLSESCRNAAALLPGARWPLLWARDGALCSWAPGITGLGSPRAAGGCWAHFPEWCFHLAGLQANRMNPPSVPFIMEMSRSGQRSSWWILVFVVESKVINTHWNPT